MQQDEARTGRRVITGARITGVEQCHLCAGIVQQAVIGGALRRVGVHPVSQQRKLRLRLRVGQVVQLQAVCQPGGGQRATQHGRHHHHHAVLQRNRLPERQPRQMARPHRLADQAVHHRHHRLGRGQHSQPRRQHPQPIRSSSNGSARLAAPQRPPDQAPSKHQERTQIDRKHRLPAQTTPIRQQALLAHAQGPLQHRPPRATQPVAGNRLLTLGTTHQVQQRLAHHHLAVSGAPRQRGNALQGLVAGGHVFGLEQGRCQHQAHQRAGARNDVRPIGVTDRAQRIHGVAHAQVVGSLVGRLLRHGHDPVRQGRLQPLMDARRAIGPAGTAALRQALRHLGQEHTPHTALVELGQQLGKLIDTAFANAVTHQIRHFTRRLVGGNPFRQPTQALDQHHTQGGRQRPQFTQAELARLQVGAQVVAQQVFVECAIGMRHESPRHTVDARQSGQRFVLQDRQAAEVVARQPFVDRLELRLDQMEIVQQPLGSRADVVPCAGLQADVGMRFTQDPHIAGQPWVKRRSPSAGSGAAMGLAQAAAVLCKTLQTKNLGANRRQHRIAGAVQQRAQHRFGARQQSQ